MEISIELYGPLKQFIGTWESKLGDDTAPADDRGTENNKFRERIVFTPFGPADNHEQHLYVLSYSRTAWRLGVDTPFHEQMGYWLWEASTGLIMHSFMIPRGMTVLAGGQANRDAKNLQLSAKLGSTTFGICSNPFLDREFKTVAYESQFKFTDGNTFSYEEDTQIQMKGHKDIFHHIDKNVLKRVN